MIMEKMISETNDFLRSINNDKLITNMVELREWLVSMQMVQHVNVAWDILYGMWDNDKLIKDIAMTVKTY